MGKAKELQELGQWKVGQIVVSHSGGTGGVERLLKITRITDGRGGTIYIEDIAFDLYGHERTSNSAWHSKSISPATEEDIKRIVLEDMRRYLQNFDWSKQSDVQVSLVYKIIKGNSE
jgi:hypothetical protein